MSGWGRFTWDQGQWGEDELLATGWGAKSWVLVNGEISQTKL
jgi:hypothetical protein